MSINVLDASKTNLGKLLASENIRIEHRNVTTASFDVKNRVLTLPLWKEMDSDVYDLLIGHEIGHSLFTPAEGWVELVQELGSSFKACLNIVEDARIEKLVKEKYPGIRKPMYSGYTKLVDRNFFGVSVEEMNFLPLIDRINCYFKIGSRSAIRFSEEEQIIVDRIRDVTEWDDVVELSLELFELHKKEGEDITEAFGDFTELSFDEDSANSTEPISKEQAIAILRENGREDLADRLEQASEELQEKIISSAEAEGGSITQDSLEENSIKSLIDNTGTAPTYAKWPKLDPKNFIRRHSEVYEYWPYFNADKEAAENYYHEFMSNNRKYIDYMVKEFTLKQSAKQFAKARISKTGKLNVDKLWGYKLTEDLFLQSTEIPNGKNHGMIMMLDMSSSMTSNMKATIHQTIALVMFCKKINIPFTVYGFSDSHNYLNPNGPNRAERENNLYIKNDKDLSAYRIADHGFKLLELFSSNMRMNEHNNAVKKLLWYGEKINNYFESGKIPEIMRLGSTPLDETISVLRWIAEDFKNTNKVEILNTVILTDGDSTSTLYPPAQNSDGRLSFPVVFEADNQNSFAHYKRETTVALLDLYKRITKSNVVGIFITSDLTPNNIKDYWYRKGENFSYDDVSSKVEQAKVHKYAEIPVRGYDVFYLISGRNMKIATEDLEEVLGGYKTQGKGTLLRAFKKTQNNKNISRVFLNRFVEVIS